jgi:hypothetical protein
MKHFQIDCHYSCVSALLVRTKTLRTREFFTNPHTKYLMMRGLVFVHAKKFVGLSQSTAYTVRQGISGFVTKERWSMECAH